MARIIKSTSLWLLLVLLLASCATIAEHEQLVSATRGSLPVRSSGECIKQTRAPDNTRTVGAGLSPDRITILDWNIHKGEDRGWQPDLARFLRSADIVLLQEASLDDELRRILDGRHLNWNFNSAFSFNRVESGVLTASAVEPLDSCGLRTSEPLIGVPKTILVSRFRLTGMRETLLVANLHAINISLGIGSYRQQFEQLSAVLSRHQGPMLVTGDFNNWNDRRTAIMEELMARHGLQAMTFTEGLRTTFFGTPVDQILFRGLEPLEQQIYQVTSSDHNPIQVSFRYSATP